MTDKLWIIGDLDRDDYLTLAEFEREFITNFDHDGKNKIAFFTTCSF
jgi:hypothetical protein